MIIDYEKGDWVSLALEAVDNEAPLWFGHGCNCQRMMGAGVAGQVRNRIPALYEADQMTQTNELGSFSFWLPNGNDRSLCLFNLYTQVDPGPNATLGGIRDCFSSLNDVYIILKQRTEHGDGLGYPQEMVIPMIGSGIGRLKWDDVAQTINEVTPDLPIVVIEYNG